MPGAMPRVCRVNFCFQFFAYVGRARSDFLCVCVLSEAVRIGRRAAVVTLQSGTICGRRLFHRQSADGGRLAI